MALVAVRLMVQLSRDADLCQNLIYSIIDAYYLTRKRVGTVSRERDALPLPRLSDQVAASVAQDGALDGSALRVLLSVYRAFAVLDRDQAQEAAEMGLTALQFNILTVLHRSHQPLTMGALADMLVVRPTNLSGNISTLAQRGLIRREINLSDQRSLLAVITPQGDAFLAARLPAHWERLERLMGGLSRRQRAQLVRLLECMSASIEQARSPAAPEPAAGN